MYLEKSRRSRQLKAVFKCGVFLYVRTYTYGVLRTRKPSVIDAYSAYRYVNVRRKTYHWKTTLFSNRNPSRGMRSLLKALKYMFFPCTEDIVDGCNVEFHSITGIICAVSSTDKIMQEHCFPQGWLLRPSWPG